MNADYLHHLQSIYNSIENFDAIGSAMQTSNKNKKLEVVVDPSGHQDDLFFLSPDNVKAKISNFARLYIPGMTTSAANEQIISDKKVIYNRANAHMQKIQQSVNGLYDELINGVNVNEETLKGGLDVLNKLKKSLSSATGYLKDQQFDPPAAKKLNEEIDRAVLFIGDKIQTKREIDQIQVNKDKEALRSRVEILQANSEADRSSLVSVPSEKSEKSSAQAPAPQAWKDQWYSPEREKLFREVNLGTESPVSIARGFIKGESQEHPGENLNKPTPMQDKIGKWMMFPTQLSLDIHRLTTVILNGKPIFMTGNSSYDPIQAYRQITTAVTLNPPLNIQSGETKESADPGTLEGQRIAALMNQGFAADLYGKMNLVSMQEDPPTSCRGDLGTHFEITTTPTDIEVTYKMAFTRVLADDPEKVHDAIMVKRTIRIPRSELQKATVDDIQMTIEDRVSNPVASPIYAAQKIKEF